LIFIAHTIRNRSSRLFYSVYTLDARHRWALTGTPIQNRLEDFGSILEFLRVYPFDNPQKFHAHFVKGLVGANNSMIEKLKTLVQAVSLRRTKEMVFKELRLSPRIEVQCSVNLNEEERRVYNIVKRSWSYSSTNSGSTEAIFNTILKLRQICNHGRDLLSAHTLQLLDGGFFTETLSEEISTEMTTCDNCNGSFHKSPSDTAEENILLCMHYICRSCMPTANDGDENGIICPLCNGNTIDTEDQGSGRGSEEPTGFDTPYQPSSKVVKLLQNLHASRTQLGDPIKRYILTFNILLITR
jgi:SNF2 family DNA or RNA helicase